MAGKTEKDKIHKLRPRKIVLRNLTEDQFMTILKKVCKPIGKSKQRMPKQSKVVEEEKVTEKK